MKYFIPCIKLHIKGNLVVTASSGMQFLSRIPDTFNQMCFYKRMNIFMFFRRYSSRCALRETGDSTEGIS